MSLNNLIELIDFPNREKCLQLLIDNSALINSAWGSSHNHQAWEGGYRDHVEEVMRIACSLYVALMDIRKLPFTLSDALLVLFLHDLEKPWKKELGLHLKSEKQAFRLAKITEYDITLSPEQMNALTYVEGEGDDYRNDKRIMNELAAFCHLCDVTSARIWYNEPKNEMAPSR